jgi:bifunctional non-homologous end joining protein LigD
LTSRNGLDFTQEFPQLAGVPAPGLQGQAAVLDGEIVVCNTAGQSDFGALQDRRGRYRRHHASVLRDEPFQDLPVRFLAFDLLRLGDKPLMDSTYDERRAALHALPMPDPALVSVVPSVTFDQLVADRLTPQQLLDQVAATGHEGLVAKLRTSVYEPGKRPESWRKHPDRDPQPNVVRPTVEGQTRALGGGRVAARPHPEPWRQHLAPTAAAPRQNAVRTLFLCLRDTGRVRL